MGCTELILPESNVAEAAVVDGMAVRGASTLMAERVVRILDAAVEPDVYVEDRHPGKVIFLREGTPIVVCGRGLLRIIDMRDGASGQSLLPLEKFRTRFT